jgi:hypothetical protein
MHSAKRILRIAGGLLLFVLLTVLTQTGGLVYILYLATNRFIHPVALWQRRLARTGWFILLYALINFLLVPPLARMAGRVPLPVRSHAHLKPLTLFTCVLNRHYVRPPLRQAATSIADAMETRYSGTTIYYLDAGFPFLNGFPLFPHLSHNDGKKLDLALLYTDTAGNRVNDAPSFIGYGISEKPRTGEVNTAAACACKGYAQYSFLQKLVPQYPGKRYLFDSIRTRQLIGYCTASPLIGKLFIEPHLKTRLQLNSSKIRFHGCQAVRHDDHIHIQL